MSRSGRTCALATRTSARCWKHRLADVRSARAGALAAWTSVWPGTDSAAKGNGLSADALAASATITIIFIACHPPCFTYSPTLAAFRPRRASRLQRVLIIVSEPLAFWPKGVMPWNAVRLYCFAHGRVTHLGMLRQPMSVRGVLPDEATVRDGSCRVGAFVRSFLAQCPTKAVRNHTRTHWTSWNSHRTRGRISLKALEDLLRCLFTTFSAGEVFPRARRSRSARSALLLQVYARPSWLLSQLCFFRSRWI